MLTITITENGKLCTEYTENPIMISDARMEADILHLVWTARGLPQRDREMLCRFARKIKELSIGE